MPTVPVYQRQVREEALTGGFTQAPANADGGLIAAGQALSKTGDAMLSIVNAKATDDAFKVEHQARMEWIETEAKLRQQYNGDNVGMYEQAVADWWKDAPTRYGQNLSPVAKAKIGKSLGQFQLSAVNAAKNFSESERSKMLDFNFAKRQDAIVQSTLSVITPTTAAAEAEAAENQMRQGVREYAVAKGVTDPEVIDQMVFEKVSQMHAGIMQQIVDTSPAEARAYLTKFGDKMTASARANSNNLISTSERNQKVLVTVDDAFKTSETEAEALEKVRKAFATDPEGTKSAVTELKTRFKERDEERDRIKDQAFERAWGIAIDGGRGRKGVDAATWNALDPKQRDSIEDEIYQRSERNRMAADRAKQKAGAGPETDWDVYADLRQKGIDGRLSVNEIRTNFPSLATKEREALLDIASKKGELLKDAATLTQQISSTVSSLELDKKNKGRFEEAVFDEINRLQKIKNKPLDQDERQKVIDKMLIEGGKPGFFNDDDIPFYKVRGTEKESSFVPRDEDGRRAFVENITLADVPAEFQEGMRKEFRNRNKVATPQTIIKAYQAYIMKGE